MLDDVTLLGVRFESIPWQSRSAASKKARVVVGASNTTPLKLEQVHASASRSAVRCTHSTISASLLCSVVIIIEEFSGPQMCPPWWMATVLTRSFQVSNYLSG
jgi:hypothetical protein